MIVKHVSECAPGENVESASVVNREKETPENGNLEKIIYNLGSLQSEGLDNLIELSNSVNKFLLESTLDLNRDGLESSQSYGVVYVISQLLKENGITHEVIFGSEDEVKSKRCFDFLVSLIACLLDNQSNIESDLDSLHKRIYFRKGTILNEKSILSLTNIIRQYPVFESKPTDTSQYKEKLASWLSIETESWSDVADFESLDFLTELADFICNLVEDMTLLSWSSICNKLSELCAVRVENGAETLLMTTRPTSSHLKLFYRLGIDLPPQVICESRGRNRKSINIEQKRLNAESLSYQLV